LLDLTRYYSGQPVDAAKKRQDVLERLQRETFDTLRRRGAVPMTAGITRPIELPFRAIDILANVQVEVARQSVQAGPSFLDRNANSALGSYRDRRWTTITGFEGVRTRVYDDAGGKAIGVGFNMSRPDAREVWKAAGITVDFDEALNGVATITNDQAKALFDYDIRNFEAVVDKAAGGRALTQNQRLALVSIAYNAPARVAGWASIIQSGDDEALNQQILYNSFGTGHSPGVTAALTRRRHAEATLFATPSEAHNSVPAFTNYNPNNAPGTVDVNGIEWGLPLVGGTVGGIPGDSRSGGARRHQGWDISGNAGDPIYAVADGTVLAIKHDDGSISGNRVHIQHADGSVSMYMHMSAFSDIQEGQKISRGAVIGAVGNTGAPGISNHLHYERRIGGRPVAEPFGSPEMNLRMQRNTVWDNTRFPRVVTPPVVTPPPPAVKGPPDLY